jgi:hypothetical protein
MKAFMLMDKKASNVFSIEAAKRSHTKGDGDGEVSAKKKAIKKLHEGRREPVTTIISHR